jgi:hypothetical protein
MSANIDAPKENDESHTEIITRNQERDVKRRAAVRSGAGRLSSCSQSRREMIYYRKAFLKQLRMSPFRPNIFRSPKNEGERP